MPPLPPPNILLEIGKIADSFNLNKDDSNIPDEMDCTIYEIEKDVFVEFVDHDISNDHFLSISVDGAQKGHPTSLFIICLSGDDEDLEHKLDYTAKRFSESLEEVTVSIMSWGFIEPHIK